MRVTIWAHDEQRFEAEVEALPGQGDILELAGEKLRVKERVWVFAEDGDGKVTLTPEIRAFTA